MQLEISSYSVPETYCRANRENVDSETDRAPVVKTLVSHIFDEDQCEIAVSLNLKNKDDLTAEDPYEFELDMFGTFKVEFDEGESVADVERFYPNLVVNAAKMLYSGARDYLNTITGKGPFGPIRLPAGYFGTKGIEFAVAKDE